jgi:hypothetical protein
MKSKRIQASRGSVRRVAGGVAIALAALLASSRSFAQPAGAIHSPMTAAVVAHLKEVLASGHGRRDAFVKIGDSNTANPMFLTCFAGDGADLAGRGDLAATRAFFSARKVDGWHTSFDRASVSAAVGWLARSVLAGSPSPLAREIDAARPAFAVVMLGTNDDLPGGLEGFEESLPRVVDGALARGVVPLLSTIPPRDDSPAAAAGVAALNHVVRALAASRGVPLMDLHAALLPLPRHGLVGDGIHLASVWEGGVPRACRFTPEALQKGMNMRNLVVLEALDRARRFLVGDEAPEADAAPGR